MEGWPGQVDLGGWFCDDLVALRRLQILILTGPDQDQLVTTGVATYLENRKNLERSGNLVVVREKSGKTCSLLGVLARVA